MINFSFTYQREGFNLTQIHDANLYVRALKTGISFLIELNGLLAAWKDFVPAADLAADGQLAELFALSFADVKLGIVPDAFTLVPSAIFDIKDTALYARYLDVKQEDKVLAAAFDDENYIVGKSGSQTARFLAKHFDLSQAVPADKGWINAINKNYPTSNQLFINIDNGQVSIANYKSLRLHFYNSFEAANISDVLYYALLATEQVQLRGNEVTLIVSGNIEQGSEDWNKLSEFFNLVKLSDQRTLELPTEVSAQKVFALSVV